MATSVKVDDDLKSRIQQLAETRHRSHTGSCVRPFARMWTKEEARKLQARRIGRLG